MISGRFNLSETFLKSAYQRNPDGIGYAGPGGIKKTLPQDYKAFAKFYKKNVQGRAGALHIRWRTDGDISLERVHPYPVIEGKLWLMHNGVLSRYRSKHDEAESDTQKLIQGIIRPILSKSPTMWRLPAFKTLLSQAVGEGNRLVFIDNLGNTEIVNQHTGFEIEGDWYANTYSFDAYAAFPKLFRPPPAPLLPTNAQKGLDWCGRPFVVASRPLALRGDAAPTKYQRSAALLAPTEKRPEADSWTEAECLDYIYGKGHDQAVYAARWRQQDPLGYHEALLDIKGLAKDGASKGERNDYADYLDDMMYTEDSYA